MASTATPNAGRRFGVSPKPALLGSVVHRREMPAASAPEPAAAPVPKLTYSVPEACQALGVKTTTLYDLIAAGRLKKVKLGTRSLIPAESLHALVASLPEAA